MLLTAINGFVKISNFFVASITGVDSGYGMVKIASEKILKYGKLNVRGKVIK